MKQQHQTYSPYSSPGLAYLVAAVVLLIAVALSRGAPPAGGAAMGAAGNLGVGVGAGNPHLGATGAGAADGALSTHGAGSAQGGAFSNAGGLGASAGGVETIGMRQDRVRDQASATTTSNADAHASVMGEAHGRSVATTAAGGGASGSLDTDATVHAIQDSAMDSRTTLLAQLHARVDTSAKAMAEVRKSGEKLDGDAKANFGSALADEKAAEKALKKSMKAAEKADDKTWMTARAKLADDYHAYAKAVARAEASSHAETKTADKDKPNG